MQNVNDADQFECDKLLREKISVLNQQRIILQENKNRISPNGEVSDKFGKLARKSARSLNVEDIKNLHKYVEKDEDAGAFRSIPVYIQHNPISAVVFPKPNEIPPKLTKLLGVISSSNHSTLALTAYQHAEFCAIHPFRDGNGRVARLWSSFLLTQDDYPPFNMPEDSRSEYFATLAHYSIYKNLCPFARMFFRTLYDTGKRIIAKRNQGNQ